MKRVITFLVVFSLISTANLQADVTDNQQRLYIPAGETYTLSGEHNYSESVNIEGTLTITAYDGSSESGTLSLSSPLITVSGVIDANGGGFPAEQGPGAGDPNGGAGAGYGGPGGDSGYATSEGGFEGGPAYGDASSMTVQKGSGGSNSGWGDAPGGTGGGAITLQADTVDIQSSALITADGQDGASADLGAGGGSGGGIMIRGIEVNMNGKLSAEGGDSTGDSDHGGGGGAGGRLKIFYVDHYESDGSTDVSGGIVKSGDSNAQNGSDGTVYSEQVVIDNNDVLYIGTGKTVTMCREHQYNIKAVVNGTLQVTGYDGSGQTGNLLLKSPRITVNGTIDADGSGYRGGYSQGRGKGGNPAAGGGYGGTGGDAAIELSPPVEGGISYGDPNSREIQMGSPGGDAPEGLVPGGNGGGAVTLLADRLEITGLLTANGRNGIKEAVSGGGSGGGILLAADEFILTGAVSAQGGNGTAYQNPDPMGSSIAGGGGGGGRIKVFYRQLELDDVQNIADADFNVKGGLPGSISGLTGEPGGQGTVCLLPILPEDLNKDGIVDFRDFSEFSENWLKEVTLE